MRGANGCGVWADAGCHAGRVARAPAELTAEMEAAGEEDSVVKAVEAAGGGGGGGGGNAA